MTKAALVEASSTAVEAPRKGSISDMFSKEELDVIKTSYTKGATDDEFFAFTKLCALRQLNPFAKEIYFVKRNSKQGPVVAHQVGIDGWRKMAASHPQWAGPGTITCHGNVEAKGYSHPKACTASYWRIIRGERTEIFATIEWSEFYPGDALGFMWRTKPNVMLKKCAEAQAIRMAFPDMMSGISLPEEHYEEMPAISLSDDNPNQGQEVADKYRNKKKTTKKKTKALPKANVETTPPPEEPPPEEPPAEIDDEDIPFSLSQMPPEEPEEPKQDGAARVMKAEGLMKKMIEMSKGAYSRDDILGNFGKKSVAELDEPEFKRMEAFIAKNGG